MKFVLCVLLLALISGNDAANSRRRESKNPRLVGGGYDIFVDHFRPQDDRQYHFHYQINLETYHENGPLYIYINDGNFYTTEWIEHGLMYDIAVEEGAALLTTDHRFYGDNVPTESATWDELNYLTIEQNIADFAFLITQVKEQMGLPFGRIVLWGTGYGATMAIWAKQKYPHLVDGVWSSSAIFYREAVTEAFYDRLEFNIGAYGGQDCAENVREAFAYMDNIIAEEDPNDLQQLQMDLGLCSPINVASAVEAASLFEVMANVISSHINALSLNGLQGFCNAMEIFPTDPYASFARWFRFTNEFDINCLDLDYQDRLTWTQHEEWDAPPEFFGWRQSLYLICTQLGLFRVTTPNSIFGNRITIDYHRRICEDAFADDYNFDQLYENIARLEIMHGGGNPSISNVIFTNGELDPFYPLGITTNMEYDSISLNIPLVGRSADLPSITLSDPFPLFNAKQMIRERVIEWSSLVIAPGKQEV